MANFFRHVDPVSGSSSNGGTSLADAYASMDDVYAENPGTASDTLTVTTYPGTDNISGDNYTSALNAGTVVWNLDPGYTLYQTNAFRAMMRFDHTSGTVTINGNGATFSHDSASGNTGLQVYNAGVTINDLIIDTPSDVGVDINSSDTGTISMTNVRVLDPGSTAFTFGFSSATTINLTKCGILDGAAVGFATWDTNITYTDCYAGGCATADYTNIGDSNASSTHNGSSDTSGSSGYHNIAVNTTNFTAPGSGDYTLPSGSALRGTASDGGNIGGFENAAAAGPETGSASGDTRTPAGQGAFTSTETGSASGDTRTAAGEGAFTSTETGSASGDTHTPAGQGAFTSAETGSASGDTRTAAGQGAFTAAETGSASGDTRTPAGQGVFTSSETETGSASGDTRTPAGQGAFTSTDTGSASGDTRTPAGEGVFEATAQGSASGSTRTPAGQGAFFTDDIVEEKRGGGGYGKVILDEAPASAPSGDDEAVIAAITLLL